jgi:2-methylisocitrate lyase-like PEP mutase family enzyme
MTQQEKAEGFRALHTSGRILVLPNVWDAASARVIEEAGFPALATTSAGVAAVLGYPDGERIGREEMAAAVARIARAVAVPVTADMEAGYGPDPAAAAATVRAVIEAGAIGLNLEDGTGDPTNPLFEVSAQVERIQAAREAARAAGVSVVLNARTDVFLAGVGEEAGRLDHALRRANAYRAAGADCLFVPLVRDAGLIAALVRGLNGPLNVLAGPGVPPLSELQRLGVARVSMGSGPMRAALTVARRVAQELLGPGTYETFTRDVLTHAEVNRLMARSG